MSFAFTPQTNPAASIQRVEAWTVDQAADVLAATTISSPSSRTFHGASVTIDIPLDDPEPRIPIASLRLQSNKAEAAHTVYKRREPIRRDSLKRRDALLKGKEGSRRRQRWENDRLLNNPYVQPPLPTDWEVRPTYPQQSVPYFLAPLWDAEYARTTAERKKQAEAAKAPASKEEAEAKKVTQELRAKLKKSRGAKGLLQDLETEVRGFVEQWGEKKRQLEREGLVDTTDSEDDEIVFVGRHGAMSDERRKDREDEALEKDKLIFESLVDDHGAAFGYASSLAWGGLAMSFANTIPVATSSIPSRRTMAYRPGPLQRAIRLGGKPMSVSRWIPGLDGRAWRAASCPGLSGLWCSSPLVVIGAYHLACFVRSCISTYLDSLHLRFQEQKRLYITVSPCTCMMISNCQSWLNSAVLSS